MRTTLALILFVCLTAVATATELGNRAPLKNDDHVLQNPVSGDRQGGDTIGDATVIPDLPYSDTGATCQYSNDYDEACPYTGSVSPDVVYSFDVPGDLFFLTVDLCGSGYDTKVYVLDAGLNVLACNDDFYFDDICGVYVSKIERAVIDGGQTVYIVVDGYGGDCGEYVLDVSSIVGTCYNGACPPGSVLEGEPELMDGYLDSYNGGCNSPEFGTPFQALEADQLGGNLVFCGRSGWYDDGFRDTDWFTVVLNSEGTGVLDCGLCGAFPTYLFELGPQDCEQVGVLQQVQSVYTWADMTIVGAPGDLVWLWVGPVTFYPPPWFQGHEYEYILELDGLQGPVATERQTWAEVKALYK